MAYAAGPVSLMLLAALTLGYPDRRNAWAQEEAAPAAAQPQTAADAAATTLRSAPPISFKVSVVYAAKKPGKVDPEGQEVLRHLPMQFGSVQMLQERSLSVAFGDQAIVPLEALKTEIRLLPVLVHQNQLHMQFELPHVVNTRLRLTNGRPVIVGGVPLSEGFVIIQVLPEFTQYLTGPAANPPSSLPETYRINERQSAAE